MIQELQNNQLIEAISKEIYEKFQKLIDSPIEKEKEVEKFVQNLGDMLSRTLYFEKDKFLFDSKIDNDTVTIIPKNFYTALLFMGKDVPYSQVEDKEVYQCIEGTFFFQNKELKFMPAQPIQKITLDFQIKNEDN